MLLPTISFGTFENVCRVKMLNRFRAKIGTDLFHAITLEQTKTICPSLN